MGHKTKVYFATDLHGSSKCFRKFVNAGPVYGADVLVLGGDVAGKALQTIVRGVDGRYRCSFIGTDHTVEPGPELEALEKLIADHGYYPYRAEPGELDARKADGSLDGLFVELMHARLNEWLQLADERLRPSGKRIYFMLGNDDPIELRTLLDGASWGVHDEGRIVMLDDDHEMISWGYSNITPWHSHREMTEEQLDAAIHGMAGQLRAPERAVFNFHVPPYGSGLDEAPVLDENLVVQTSLGQPQDGARREHRRPRRDPRDPAAARSARPHPRVEWDPPARSDDRDQPGLRLLDRRAERDPGHPRAGQGDRPPAGPGLR